MKSPRLAAASGLVSGLLSLALTTLGVAAPTAEQPLELTGVVKSTAGRLLTNASVFIYTASPRVGPGYI